MASAEVGTDRPGSKSGEINPNLVEEPQTDLEEQITSLHREEKLYHSDMVSSQIGTTLLLAFHNQESQA